MVECSGQHSGRTSRLSNCRRTTTGGPLSCRNQSEPATTQQYQQLFNIQVATQQYQKLMDIQLKAQKYQQLIDIKVTITADRYKGNNINS